MNTFQILNTPYGYIVEWRRDDGRADWVTVRPLRNFGSRQSDAIEYCHNDCPKMRDHMLELTAKHFNVAKTHKRVGFQHYELTNDIFIGNATRTLTTIN